MTEENKFENVLNMGIDAIDALAGVHPVTGSISSFIKSRQAREQNQRTEYFVTYVREALIELNRNIEDMSGETKATLDLAIEKSMNSVKNEIITEKRQAYAQLIRNLVLNSTDSNVVIYKTELFLSTLENISKLEISILKIALRAYENLSKQTIDILEVGATLGSNIDSYIVAGSVSSLKNKGLLITGGNMVTMWNENDGHTQVGDVKLSEFGREFLNYCFTNF